MALFKCSQNSDPIQNQFWELPGHYWIGPMLVDKYTMKPVAGYDVPSIQSTNAQIPTSSTYSMCGLFYQPYIIGNMLGKTGLLHYAGMNLRYIAQTNDPDGGFKSYYIDPEDTDYVYFEHLSQVPGTPSFLTKYNTKTHQVVWDTNTLGSYYSCYRLFIFASYSSCLYALFHHGEISDKVHTRNYMNNYPHGCTWSIIQIDKTSGFATKQAALLNLPGGPSLTATYRVFSLGDCHDCQYLGETKDGKYLFLYSYLDAPVGPGNTSSKFGVQRIGFFLYNLTQNTIEPIPNPLVTPDNWKDQDNGYCYTNKSPHDAVFHGLVASKPSNPDPTILDKVVCYGHWGKLLGRTNIPSSIPKDEIRQIWKHVYDPQACTQSFMPMTVLNKDGATMEEKDWTAPSNLGNTNIYVKFYVIKGEDDKKFLMAHEGAGYWSHQELQSYCKDNNFRTYIFEFQDENTLKLVHSINLACTCLFWVKPNVFIAGYKDKIRIYSIDKKTGALSCIRNITPSQQYGVFTFLSIDDTKNIWISEMSPDQSAGSCRAGYLYYFNSYTVYQMQITPEKSKYIKGKADVETWVDLAVFSDLGDQLATDVNVALLGPAKFKESGQKTVKTKTKVDQNTRLNILLTGVGEVMIKMSLAS